MKTLIITFKSRNQLLNFTRILKQNQIPYSIINTPNNISSTCTLSLNIPQMFYNKVLALIKQYKPSGFLGLFLIDKNNYNQTQRLFWYKFELILTISQFFVIIFKWKTLKQYLHILKNFTLSQNALWIFQAAMNSLLL